MINIIAALACGVMSVFQVQLYLTRKKKWPQILICLGIAFVTWAFLMPDIEHLYMYIILISPMVFLPIVMVSYEEKVFCKLHNMFVQAAAASASMLLGKSLYQIFKADIPSSILHYFVPLVFILTLGIWTLSMWYLRSHNLAVEPYDEVTYMQGFFQSTIVYILIGFSYIISGFDCSITSINNISLVVAVVSIIIVAYTIAVFVLNRNILIRQKMLSSVYAQRDFFKKYLEAMQDKQNSARILKHDIDEYIESTKRLFKTGDYQRFNENLDSLALKSKDVITDLYCDDTLINAIITDYAERAKKNDTKFTCICRIEEPLLVQDLDVSAILFNGLNNALESCEKIPNIQKRKIDVVIYTIKGFFVVKIRNAYEEKPKIKNNHISTRKKESPEMHGIGLRSIDMVVSKYGGRKLLSIEKDVFQLEVTIYNENKPVGMNDF